jgi:hypothetical protein
MRRGHTGLPNLTVRPHSLASYIASTHLGAVVGVSLSTFSALNTPISPPKSCNRSTYVRTKYSINSRCRRHFEFISCCCHRVLWLVTLLLAAAAVPRPGGRCSRRSLCVAAYRIALPAVMRSFCTDDAAKCRRWIVIPCISAAYIGRLLLPFC